MGVGIIDGDIFFISVISIIILMIARVILVNLIYIGFSRDSFSISIVIMGHSDSVKLKKRIIREKSIERLKTKEALYYYISSVITYLLSFGLVLFFVVDNFKLYFIVAPILVILYLIVSDIMDSQIFHINSISDEIIEAYEREDRINNILK
jgi:hypothetical protein